MKSLWLSIAIFCLSTIKPISSEFGSDLSEEELIRTKREDTNQMDTNNKPNFRSGTTEERGRLINQLFKDYDKKNYPSNATLQLGLALINVDIDKERSTMESQNWLWMEWNDPRLSWDEKEFDVAMLRISLEDIWKPDVTLYNSADQPGMVKCWSSNVGLYSNGNILWTPGCYFSGFCDVSSLSQDPFAPFKCSFMIGSWTFDGKLLPLALYKGLAKADLQPLMKRKWELIGNEAKINDVFFSCCAEPYPLLKFDFTLKRTQRCG